MCQARGTIREASQPYTMIWARQICSTQASCRTGLPTCHALLGQRPPYLSRQLGKLSYRTYLRCRILDRIRRFFWPRLRRPLPDFLTPMLCSGKNSFKPEKL